MDEPVSTLVTVIFGWWIIPTRGILRFLSGGLLPRVWLRDFWAVDYSRAWKYAISERWTTPARGITQFPSDGMFLRVGLHDFWAVDYSCAWDCAISERWNVPTRKKSQFLGDGLIQRTNILISQAISHLCFYPIKKLKWIENRRFSRPSKRS